MFEFCSIFIKFAKITADVVGMNILAMARRVDVQDFFLKLLRLRLDVDDVLWDVSPSFSVVFHLSLFPFGNAPLPLNQSLSLYDATKQNLKSKKSKCSKVKSCRRNERK